jgi:hypothetical protein
MERLLLTCFWILLSSVCLGQSMAKTKTAKQITVKSDTIGNKVYIQQVYEFKKDTAYINQQDSTIIKMDAIINKKKK